MNDSTDPSGDPPPTPHGIDRLDQGRWVRLWHHGAERARGEPERTSGPPTTQGDHFDLMFETPAGLVTWAVDRVPDDRPQRAWLLPLHRAAYLDFEGEVSGGRGFVRRDASGIYRLIERSFDASRRRIELDLIAERWRFECDATGTWTVVRFEDLPAVGG